MRNTNLVFIVLIVVFFLTMVASIIFDKPVADPKWDRCLDRVNQVAPDPNDTEERSQILKECYNN